MGSFYEAPLSDLFDKLQEAIGDTYHLEKELGGGGMSRVFLAEEVSLARRVVIKVLPPQMAADVNRERFHREIQLAAKLQHPHVVQLLTAGSHGDLLYYVMPFIEGESLRAKLQREGELPIAESLRILKEVIDALAYAHAEGVVHRDIKPDNILLSRNHALVADFGVAKAVTASSGSSLTSLGVALGTPAYMSPEQAAADPHTDHRADIYAVGVLAYEMLSGQPPFTGPTPQAVMAAHMSDSPDPITKWRPAVSVELNDVVMRCLEKRAADRWQSATDLLPQFEVMTTPTGGMTPTGTAPMASVSAATMLRRSHPGRVLGLYAVGSLAVFGIAYLLMMQLGLPDWVLPAAGGLLAVGLPVMFFAARVERQHATTMMTAASSGVRSTNLSRHWLTWRTAMMGGAGAFTGLTVAVAIYMAMRVLGIGPVGTLTASGVLDEQDRLILADFDNRTSDSTLGETVTELFRIAIAQSTAVTVLEPRQLAGVLRLMERAADEPMNAALAHELAERQGLKAFITGDILPIGSGYVISARVVAALTGETLALAKETASGPDDIIQAVDDLSAQLRGRIGESLRTVRADPPLAQVTTGSMEALRIYIQARSIGNRVGDYERAVSLLDEAMQVDSQFAMAYRRQAAYLSNSGQGERADSAITRAYELRQRLTERERYLVEALYAFLVENDQLKSIERYETLLDKHPDDGTALNNLAINYRNYGRWSDAENLALRALANGPGAGQLYEGLIASQANQGKFAAAESTLAESDRINPGRPNVISQAARLASSQGDYDAAERHTRRLREEQRTSPRWQQNTAFRMATLSTVRGKLAEGNRWLRQGWDLLLERGIWDEERRESIAVQVRVENELHYAEYWHGLDTARMVATLEDLWQQYATDLKEEDLPYRDFARAFAHAGAPDRALEVLDEEKADVERDYDRAVISLYQGKPLEAAEQFRTLIENARSCKICNLFELGYTYDRAGNADSALTIYERYLNTPWLGRVGMDSQQLPIVLRRLGELYEQRGDKGNAVEYYRRFAELWENSDPELQPYVRDVRERIVQLTGERAGGG